MTTKQNKTKQKLVRTVREYGRSFWALGYSVSVSGGWSLRLVQCVKSIELYAYDIYTFPNIYMHNQKLK